MSWEKYFRGNTLVETRAAAKALDRETTAEAGALQAEIGDRPGEILGLVQRVEELKLLVHRQDTELAEFASSSAPFAVPTRAFSAIHAAGLGENHILDVVTARLLSTIDRNIVQRKYELAARALYLADLLGLDRAQFCAAAAKLQQRLDACLLKGTELSRSTLYACVIVRRVPPAVLVSQFLSARQAYIARLLSEDGDVISAFKTVDSTLPIYRHLTNNFCQSELPKRRISEAAEFADHPLLLRLIQSSPQAAASRLFPTECYEKRGGVEDSAAFLDSVAREVEGAASRLFGAAETASALTNAMSKLVFQSQSLLSSEIGRLMDVCEPPFSAKFKQIVKRDSSLVSDLSPKAIESWRQRVNSLKSEQTQIARFTRNSANLAPKFSARLTEVESQIGNLLESTMKASYTTERTRLLNNTPDTLEGARALVQVVVLLDSTYSLVGGEPAEPPKPLYDQLARLIVDQWKLQPEQSCHNSGITGLLFEFMLIVDATLSETLLTPSILESLRPAVIDRVREVSPELVGDLEHALDVSKSESNQNSAAGESSCNYSRSRLLLRPLVL